MLKTEFTAFSMSLDVTYWFIGPALLSEDLSLVEANQLEEDVSNWSWILRMMVRVLKYRFLMSWRSLPTQRLRQSKIWPVTFLRIAVR